MGYPVERRARLISVPRPALIALAAARARLRASEFGMTALAIGVGVLAGLCVAAMTKIVNVAHVAIFGIPFDVHLSAAERVTPIAAFGAPMRGEAGDVLPAKTDFARAHRQQAGNALDDGGASGAVASD